MPAEPIKPSYKIFSTLSNVLRDSHALVKMNCLTYSPTIAESHLKYIPNYFVMVLFSHYWYEKIIFYFLFFIFMVDTVQIYIFHEYWKIEVSFNFA